MYAGTGSVLFALCVQKGVSMRIGIRISLLCVLFLAVLESKAAFESAVITLQFPPGARSTGLGEAFTGLADDPTAMFYNPAGLGQAPLSHSWKHEYHAVDYGPFTHITAFPGTPFVSRPALWASTACKGLVRFRGGTHHTKEFIWIHCCPVISRINSTG
jgi:hypothetical protein